MGEGENNQTESKESALAGLIKEAGKQLITVLLTAGSLIGFVAFAGGVIVWTRFSAAKVPPDQAVNAVPRDELVAIGSSLLLIFGFFGALALMGAFLIDRGARATRGMAWALLGIFLIEAVTTVTLVGGLSPIATIAVAELIALPVAVAFWATFAAKFADLIDDLPTRPSERPGLHKYPLFLLSPQEPGDLYPPLPGVEWLSGRFARLARRRRRVFRLRRRLVRIHRRWVPVRDTLKRIEPTWVAGLAIAGAAVIVVIPDSSYSLLFWWLTGSLITFALFVLWCSLGVVRRLNREIRPLREKLRKEEGERVVASVPKPVGGAMEAAKYHEDRARKQDKWRQIAERPLRLETRGNGDVLIGLLLAAAVVLPWMRLDLWWVGVSIAAAAVLCVALWRIAALSARRVVWYGVAVFLSVPLFGTLTAMARNVADPQVQPMALIRNTDGPYEAIQGLYVTEANDRVYFATVATEGCTNRLRAHSGRLEWVPKSEVVAMSVGPLQDVKQAGNSALEMAYALTPGVEMPAGGEASLTPGERQAAEAEEKPSGPLLDKRLENTGSAVRPYYGAGLSLDPENASPGEHVTLRMSTPNEDPAVDGFGATRNGHTVRVGGVRAKILKEPARKLEGIEYLETTSGIVLTLAKGEPFARRSAGGAYVSVVEAEERGWTLGRRRFVELTDPRVRDVEGQTPVRGSWFLELDPNRIRGGYPQLAKPYLRVTLKGAGGDTGARETSMIVRIRPRPLGQAWHPREIRFEVPENASTGAVSVECSQLAGQPLLRVSHAPEARMSVRMQAGSDRVSFDSDHSSDADGEKLSQRWDIAGLRHGTRMKISAALPSQLKAYAVSLTEIDESGKASTVKLHLLRLPASLFAFGRSNPQDGEALDAARKALRRVVRIEPPASIEIDGHADDPGSRRYNAALSLHRAQSVREALLGAPLMDAPVAAEVPVRTLGYGEDCPVDARHGPRPRDRRVDVFVLDRGVSMTMSGGCGPRRFESSDWPLVTCKPVDPPTAGSGFSGEMHKLVWGSLAYLLGGEPGLCQP